jgi:hypothetical protein
LDCLQGWPLFEADSEIAELGRSGVRFLSCCSRSRSLLGAVGSGHRGKGRLSKTLFMTRVEPNSCRPGVRGWVDLAGDHS